MVWKAILLLLLRKDRLVLRSAPRPVAPAKPLSRIILAHTEKIGLVDTLRSRIDALEETILVNELRYAKDLAD